jgi:C4-dicarboxylate-specific signal transduction histidine kinase
VEKQLQRYAAERNHDQITFHVRDNGRGIAAEDMPKVFAPFHFTMLGRDESKDDIHRTGQSSDAQG